MSRLMDDLTTWLHDHPRIACFVICAVCTIPLWIEVPR